MCITVDEQHDYQIIYISAANKPMERIAVLDPARTTRFNFLKKTTLSVDLPSTKGRFNTFMTTVLHSKLLTNTKNKDGN